MASGDLTGNRTPEQTRRALLAKAGLGTVAGLGIAAIAAPEQALASTITGWINVMDSPYFAGTGVADDGPEINNAIANAATLGAVVFFPPGTYKIGTTIRVKDNTHLKGSGDLKSKLLATSALTGGSTMIVNEGLFTGQPNSNIVIEDLEIDGNKSNRSGATGHLIELRGTEPTGPAAERVHLRRLYGHDSPQFGFVLRSCSDSEIVGCEVADCGRDGADFWFSSQRCRVAYNCIHGCGDDAIALNAEDFINAGHTLTDIAVVGNVLCTGTGPGNGIRVLGAKRVTISGNVVLEPYQDGIVVQSSQGTAAEDISITGNVIKDVGHGGTSGSGINVRLDEYASLGQADVQRVVIADNVVVGAKENCIHIRGLTPGKRIADVAITNNVLERPTVHGIAITSGGTGLEITDVSIDGNTLIGATDSGFGMNISASAQVPIKRVSISNNRVRDWSFTGIGVFGPNVLNSSVIGNTSFDNGIRGNSGFGLHLKSIDGLTVVGNRARGNKGGGINFEGTVSETLVNGNDASGNTGFGIALVNTTGQNLISDNMVTGNTGTAIQRTNLNSFTFVFQNVGDDPAIARHLSGTVGWTPPAVNKATSVSTTVPVPGAVVGDTVAVGFSTALPAGLLLVGAVTAAGTVTVTLYNSLTVSKTVAAGTLRADVWKH